jgi:hypothetical protein
MENNLTKRMDNIESTTNKAFKVIFEKLDSIQESTPILKPKRKKIGLK